MGNDLLYPLRRLHGFLHEEKLRQIRYWTYRKQYSQIFRKNPHTVFLCMTPEHGNLGDHAITVAIFEVLKKSNINWIEVTDRQLVSMDRDGVLGVMNGYPILICGGGNLGTLWMNLETMMRKIVQKNPRSPIAILPNTIYYEPSPWGNQELEKAKLIYNRHQKLRFYAREKTSYDFMKPIFRDVRLVPDMVLSLDRCTTDTKRNGCILCLRSDLEKTRSQEQEDAIRQQAMSIFGDQVKDSDMIEQDAINPKDRDAFVQHKLAEFSSAELVITDRLHGMIFCAVTGTSCIVVDSKSPKLRGCYEWIRDLDYILFSDDMNHISQLYDAIPKGHHRYQNQQLIPYFDQFAKDIQNMIQ